MRLSPDIADLVGRVKAFVRTTIIPYETDRRCGDYGPSDALVAEMDDHARTAGLMTPHIRADGHPLSQVETAAMLRASGLSMLGPVALNTAAPDEDNMFLLGKVGSAEQQQRFLGPWSRATRARPSS